MGYEIIATNSELSFYEMPIPWQKINVWPSASAQEVYVVRESNN